MGRVGQDAAFPRYRTKSGWAFEIVQLTFTPNHRDGSWIRLTHHGFFVESSGIAVDGREPAGRPWSGLFR
jgi:hypothetical protein